MLSSVVNVSDNKVDVHVAVDYDMGQQIALGGDATSTTPVVLPTYADVLAAFPTWQGQVALFVPNK